MQFYASMKRNEVLLYCIAWMNIKNIMLGKKSDIKVTDFGVFVYRISNKSQIHIDKIANG